ncbi:MAG: hypothetical protein V3V62_13645, partial [bacterium]
RDGRQRRGVEGEVFADLTLADILAKLEQVLREVGTQAGEKPPGLLARIAGMVDRKVRSAKTSAKRSAKVVRSAKTSAKVVGPAKVRSAKTSAVVGSAKVRSAKTSAVVGSAKTPARRADRPRRRKDSGG